MEYKTFRPDSDLGALVKCYWTLRIPKDVPKGRQQVLSDGCLDMIFNLGDIVRRLLPGNKYSIQPRSFVLGQITKPMWIEPMGKVETFAVRFNPGSFSYFTQASMTDLADKDTELKELFDENKVTLIESAIANAKDTPERISLIEDFLFDVIRENIDLPVLLRSMIDRILQTNGTVSIKEVMEDNLSQRRSLERKFAEQVGTSPKQLCRAIRFQRTLKSMLENKMSLTEVGCENGYYDQSHFIKDFKEYTGKSPKEFYKDKSSTLSSVLYSKE